MSWAAVAVAGASVVGAAAQSRSASKAVSAQERALGRSLSEQERARIEARRLTEPFRQLGLSTASPLAELLGLNIPAESTEAGIARQARIDELDLLIEEPFAPPPTGITNARQRIAGITDPQVEAERAQFARRREQLIGERNELLGQQEIAPDIGVDPPVAQQSEIERINPVLSFLRDEGFEDIQESAAARGRLGAGGTLEELTEFNTNLAATIVPQLQQQRFSQLFNLLGLGSNVAAGQGTQQLQSAANIGNLQQALGSAQAVGAQQQGAIQAGLVSDLSGAFGLYRGSQPPPPPPPRQDVDVVGAPMGSPNQNSRGLV